jgi:hypothetical protein
MSTRWLYTVAGQATYYQDGGGCTRLAENLPTILDDHVSPPWDVGLNGLSATR